VVAQKRIFIAAAGALAATLALGGCGTENAISSAQSAAIKAGPSAVPAEDLVAASEQAQAPLQEGDDLPQETEEVPQEPDATEAEAEAQPAAIPKANAQPVGKLTNKLIAKRVPRMGNVVTDAKGWVLYRFDKDRAAPSKSNCVGDCAIIWPPVLADETLELSGIAASKVDTVERPDGGLQVTIGGLPVYRYLGDKKPGSWKGQNVGGTWFVIQRDGQKNLTCLPKISKPVPLPADPAKTKAKKAAAAAVPEDAESDTGYDSGGY
jgi:predicted lipoprotein with Yx(FWY)xxD motif